MPPRFFSFLAVNWCNMVDSGRCCWGKFSDLRSQGGGGRGGRATLMNPPPLNDKTDGYHILSVQTESVGL